MPRTGRKGKGGKRADPNNDPVARFSKLERHDKIICYNYWNYINTNGSEGWNPQEAGSVFHQRSSAYLLSLGSASWFRHRGKAMVTLSQKFAELQQTPPENPTTNPPPVNRTAATFTTPPSSPIPTMLSPRGQRKKSNAAVLPPPVPSFEEEDPELNLGVPAPTCFGGYKQFNYTTRVSVKSLLVRMILHNGVTENHIQFEWLTPRVLKIRIAWPEWFQFAEQMAEFTLDEQGNMVFPPEHPLTMDTSERNQDLVEEDGRIWDEGVIKFEEDMKHEDIPIFELLNVKIDAQGTTVKVLQMGLE